MYWLMSTAVLISGGVDSSVALRLVCKQGIVPTAFYLKIWLEDELSYLGNCPWEDDLSVVRQVCAQAGVSLEVISLQHEYWDIVVKYTVDSVKAGRTPSPDILCNQYIKFGAFFDAVDKQFNKVVTGHYALTEEQDGIAYLKKAIDPVKDQTYFLSRLNQNQLSKLWFPLGNLYKSEVRTLATEFDLVNQTRKDSQGICFLGKFKFSDFIKHHVGVLKGDLVEFETGKRLGSHEGFWYYTIGQRKGIGLGGGPWYVVAKDTTNNIVYISSRYYDEDKPRDLVQVEDITWLSLVPSVQAGNYQVKVRHGEVMHEAYVEFLDIEKTKAKVKLARSDQGLAAGQFVVFYQGDYCLGAGVIAEQVV